MKTAKGGKKRAVFLLVFVLEARTNAPGLISRNHHDFRSLALLIVQSLHTNDDVNDFGAVHVELIVVVVVVCRESEMPLAFYAFIIAFSQAKGDRRYFGKRRCPGRTARVRDCLQFSREGS